MRNLLLLGLCLCFLGACQKEDFPELSAANYYPLNIGNYWVYQNVRIDASGYQTLMNVEDSIIITGDTLIRGNTYFRLEGYRYLLNRRNWEIIDHLRDSSGYIVNAKGRKLFTADNFEDVLYSHTEVIGEDTLYSVSYKMERPPSRVNVEAGSFAVLNYKGTVTSPQTFLLVEYPRVINNYYSPNVGKVSQNVFYLNSAASTDKRLLRYHVR